MLPVLVHQLGVGLEVARAAAARGCGARAPWCGGGSRASPSSPARERSSWSASTRRGRARLARVEQQQLVAQPAQHARARARAARPRRCRRGRTCRRRCRRARPRRGPACRPARRSTSISISHAASASAPGVIEVRRACARPFSRQTVYAPEEPIPVPAGTSATEAISSGFPRQWRSSVSRRIGWRISRDLVDLLHLGVLHPVAALEDRVGEHVDVLVDRAGDEEAAVLAVVGGQVGAAAAERDAQRRAAEDHAHRRAPAHRDRVSTCSRHAYSFSASQSSVRTTASRIVSARLPAERADPRRVEVDQRAVARSSRAARRCARSRARRPRCAVMIATDSSTTIVSSVPRL